MVDAILPPQHSGGNSQITITRNFRNAGRSDEVYKYLKLILLDVNNWHRYIKGVSARFQLTDKDGRANRRQALTGDHFKIRIPGPPLRLGGGFDWTIVKRREELSDGGTELFYLTASPSANPRSDSDEIAHFLKNIASTTFIALKDKRMVRLLIISRNEVANNQVPGWQDQWRNRTVGLFAALYFSRFQWSKLARSIMKAGLKSADNAGTAVEWGRY